MSFFDRFSKKAFSFLFHLVLSLMLIDWAIKLPGAVGGIGIYEITFVLLGFVSMIRLFFEKGKVIQKVSAILHASKWNVIVLSGYMLFGLITLLYAQTPQYAMTKYIVAVQMIFFGICLFYYLHSHQEGSEIALRKVYFNIGLSAVISALWALVQYFLSHSSRYPAIISPVDDYNQYSTILLVGWVCATVYVARKPLPVFKKYILIALFSGILLPMVLVSGSRRSYVFAYLVVAAVLILAIYLAAKALFKKVEARVIRSAVCVLLACTFFVACTSVTLTNTVTILSQRPGTGAVNPGDDPNDPSQSTPEQGGSSAQDRLNDGSGLGKRRLIWSAAIKEIQQYDFVALLVGKGASHSSDFYDDLAKPGVKEIYESYGYSETSSPEKNWMNPHNLFLQDLLDGGLLLLLAQLSIILAAVFYILRIIRANPVNGTALLLMYGVLLLTLLLSSARGIISNKFFWLITMLQMSECYNLRSASKQ